MKDYFDYSPKIIVGTEVELSGWVDKIRNLGKIIFLELRFRYVHFPLIINEDNSAYFDLAKTLKCEDVIKVKGFVHARPEKMVNKNIKYGNVDIIVSKCEILNRAEPLPINLSNYIESADDVRLKYRYLDMRKVDVARNIVFRASVMRHARLFLDSNGFVEIETPFLTRSTPEGARDYLIPSRVHKGNFYALPQSPQIFKQLLMSSGFDRYYNITRCFRDEDLRSDRQPEFSQIDIEMSFADELQVRDFNENMVKSIFKHILDINLDDFPILKYEEAITHYGTDAPDLRIPLEINDVTKLLLAGVSGLDSEELKGATLVLNDFADRVSKSDVADYLKIAQKLVREAFFSVILVKDMSDESFVLHGSRSLGDEFLFHVLRSIGSKNGDLVFLGFGEKNLINKVFSSLIKDSGRRFNLYKQNWAPVWVTDFPLFCVNESGDYSSNHHPFTAPREQDIEFIKTDPGKVIARAYDLVINGSEVGGGSIRIHDRNLQELVFDVLGLSKNEAKDKFGYLLEALKYGFPPHGGIAYGLDRMVMIMLGLDSIRDVIAFPKTQNGTCLLTRAPSKVSDEQLELLGINIDDK